MQINLDQHIRNDDPNRCGCLVLSDSKFVGCLVGSAIGDALGAAYEGTEFKSMHINDVPFEGVWTDDTHMLIGLSESLIACHGFRGSHMAQTFLRNWETEPWRGYGPGPPQVFRLIKSGVPWNEAAKRLYSGAGSFGNGAAMRVAPVGLLYHNDTDTLRDVACLSAAITHTHPLGIEGASIQAHAVALALQTNKRNLEPGKFIDTVARFTRNRIYRRRLEKAKTLLSVADKRVVIKNLGNGVEAFNSVPTAIYSFARNHGNYSKAVRYAISLGGDTDTIAAMTGALSGAYHGQENFPESWKENLEKVGYITQLASSLWSLSRTKKRVLTYCPQRKNSVGEKR